MIDRHGAVLFVPFLGRRLRIGNDALELRLARHGAAEDRGVKLAVEQHFGDVLAGGGALDAGRVAIFGDVRVLERDPFHRAEIEP